MAIIHFNADPYTAEQIVVRNVAVGLTTSNFLPSTGVGRGQGPVMAFITLEADAHTATGNVRFHLASQAAAIGTGHLLYVGDSLVLDGLAQMQYFNVINASSGTSTLAVTYFIG